MGAADGRGCSPAPFTHTPVRDGVVLFVGTVVEQEHLLAFEGVFRPISNGFVAMELLGWLGF